MRAAGDRAADAGRDGPAGSDERDDLLRPSVAVAGAERKLEAPEGAEYLRRELAHGTYHRELTLPEGVDPERMTARYEGGILEIRVPYQASRAVRIPVEIASSEPKALKATA